MSRMYINPFGDRQFFIQLFSVSDIPDRVDFNRYYEGVCEITLTDARPSQQYCLVHRPSNRRNVVGNRITDWLILLVKTELTHDQLKAAAIRVVRFDDEIAELEAKERMQL